MRLDFDRGTVVCSTPDAGLDTAALPGVLWDERVGCFRAPAYRYSELVAQLTGNGVSVDDAVWERERVQLAAPALALRPYQQAAIGAWDAFGRRGVVVLPTGAGKTHVAFAGLLQAQCATLCLVPTRILLQQWLEGLRGMLGCEVGVYGDGERSLAPITVATFESAYRHMAELGNRFELLIIDEAHHFGSGVRDEALEMSCAPFRLGLTATPPKNDAAQRLQRLIGPTVYELSVGDLRGTYLANFEIVVLTLDLTPEEREAYESEMGLFRPLCRQFFRTNPLASWADFASALRGSEEGRMAFAAWLSARERLAFTHAKARVLADLLARHRDSRVLVFTANNDTAYRIARRHLVMPLTCEIGRRERERVLERFRSGELRTLVSARVLNEGLDVPDADVAVIVGGTHGEREHVQRIGRLLRPRPGKKAVIYELVTRATPEVRNGMERRRTLATRTTAFLPAA